MHLARAQSSTSYPINFLMVLNIDHTTPAVSKTVTITLSKNGAAYGAASGAVSEIANGVYSLPSNPTDQATPRELWLPCPASGCDNVDFCVPIITDDLFAAYLGMAFPTNFSVLSVDGNGRVDVIKLNGTSQTARDIGASVLLSAGTGTGQLDFTSGVVKANLVQI